MDLHEQPPVTPAPPPSPAHPGAVAAASTATSPTSAVAAAMIDTGDAMPLKLARVNSLRNVARKFMTAMTLSTSTSPERAAANALAMTSESADDDDFPPFASSSEPLFSHSCRTTNASTVSSTSDHLGEGTPPQVTPRSGRASLPSRSSSMVSQVAHDRDLFVRTAVLLLPEVSELASVNLAGFRADLGDKILSHSSAAFLLGKALYIFPTDATKVEFKTVLTTPNELRTGLLALLEALAADKSAGFTMGCVARSPQPLPGY